MTGLQFVATLVSVAMWPLAIVIVLALFRREIRGLLTREIKSLKAGPLEAVWETHQRVRDDIEHLAAIYEKRAEQLTAERDSAKQALEDNQELNTKERQRLTDDLRNSERTLKAARGVLAVAQEMSAAWSALAMHPEDGDLHAITRWRFRALANRITDLADAIGQLETSDEPAPTS